VFQGGWTLFWASGVGCQTGNALVLVNVGQHVKTYNLYEAKTALSKLVDRAAEGEEIVIAKAGKPLAKLVPLSSSKRARKPGAWKGKVWIAPDFDEPLPEQVLDEFEGEG
jgi:prevent-host-death family protein